MMIEIAGLAESLTGAAQIAAAAYLVGKLIEALAFRANRPRRPEVA